MNKHFIVITAVMVIGVFGLSATANSQETFETVIPDFVVTCTSTGQLCDPPFSVSGEIGSLLQVQYFVPSAHCSSLRVHLFVDGTFKVTTGFSDVAAPAAEDVLPYRQEIEVLQKAASDLWVEVHSAAVPDAFALDELPKDTPVRRRLTDRFDRPP